MKKCPVTLFTAIVYALLLLIGGLIGYLKAGSTASLITSSSLAILMLICAALILRRNDFGLRFASLLTLIVLVFFSYRWWLTGAVMPAGIMMGISLVALFIFLASSTRKVDSLDK
jgi:uncharacterized membrane protein (UPF0136 family)